MYTGTQLHSATLSREKHSPPYVKFTGEFASSFGKFFKGEKLLFILRLKSWIPRVFANRDGEPCKCA